MIVPGETCPDTKGIKAKTDDKEPLKPPLGVPGLGMAAVYGRTTVGRFQRQQESRSLTFGHSMPNEVTPALLKSLCKKDKLYTTPHLVRTHNIDRHTLNKDISHYFVCFILWETCFIVHLTVVHFHSFFLPFNP